jgi:putative YhbY family RNA-binding protein
MESLGCVVLWRTSNTGITVEVYDLTSAQRSALKARAHSIRPVVAIGSEGLSRAVLDEIDRSLRAHELIKLRTYGLEREMRKAMMLELCAALEAAPVQHIGKTLVIFRRNPDRPAEAAPPSEHLPARPVHGPKPRRRQHPISPRPPSRR